MQCECGDAAFETEEDIVNYWNRIIIVLTVLTSDDTMSLKIGFKQLITKHI